MAQALKGPFRYEKGPDWKLWPQGPRFQPRISRALSRFLIRAQAYTPDLIPLISPTNRWGKWADLIASDLWRGLAPELGVALAEVDILPLDPWPAVENGAKTPDGRHFWITVEGEANKGLLYFRLMGGHPAHPTEVQKVYIDTATSLLLLTSKKGTQGYPSLTYLRCDLNDLNGWVDMLRALHLYGRALESEGSDRYFGQQPLDEHRIRRLLVKIQTELRNRQEGGESEPFPTPEGKLVSASPVELITAYIGWSFVLLAIDKLKKTFTPEQEAHLGAEWLRTVKQFVGPLYPGMSFEGTTIDRSLDRPQINVVYRGSDAGMNKVSKKAQQDWNEKLQKAAASLSNPIDWAYTFGLTSRP